MKACIKSFVVIIIGQSGKRVTWFLNLKFSKNCTKVNEILLYSYGSKLHPQDVKGLPKKYVLLHLPGHMTPASSE